MTMEIDLSKGWDSQEIDKMITSLPFCSETDRKMMAAQNKTLGILLGETFKGLSKPQPRKKVISKEVGKDAKEETMHKMQ